MNLKEYIDCCPKKSTREHLFLELYDRYYVHVFSYALQITRSFELAEDITQDVFVKMWERGSLDDVRDIDAFFRIATRNHTLKAIRRNIVARKAMNRIQADWVEHDTTTEEHIVFRDTGRLLRDVVDKMPPQRRLVYRLCKEEGLAYAEVAQRMNLSLSSVKTHMLLALRFIREYLRKYDDQSLLIVCVGIIIKIFFQ